jgi:hypothetical protein
MQLDGPLLGQTKEDINTRSVKMTATRSARYIIGSGGDLTRLSCFPRNGYWWCGLKGFVVLRDCVKYCSQQHYMGKD